MIHLTGTGADNRSWIIVLVFQVRLRSHNILISISWAGLPFSVRFSLHVFQLNYPVAVSVSPPTDAETRRISIAANGRSPSASPAMNEYAKGTEDLQGEAVGLRDGIYANIVDAENPRTFDTDSEKRDSTKSSAELNSTGDGTGQRQGRPR